MIGRAVGAQANPSAQRLAGVEFHDGRAVDGAAASIAAHL
jgi:hypothetical protein